jgi:ABC-type multidrug transport system fused ATPase/permease subunit
MPTHKALFQLYGHLSRRRRVQLVLLLALMVLAALCEVATLGAVLPFLALIANPDALADHGSLRGAFAFLGFVEVNSLLLAATILFTAVAIGAGIIRLLFVWASNRLMFGLAHDVCVDVYRRTLYQPYDYHIAKNTSEVVAATNKVQLVVGGILLSFMQAVTAAIISVFIFAALLAIDPLVALGCGLLFAAIYLVIMSATRNRLRVLSRLLSRALPERVKTLQEGLGGIRDVLLDHAQAICAEKFRAADAGFQRAHADSLFIGAAPRFVLETCGIVLIAFLGLLLTSREGGLTAALPVLGALALGAQRMLPLLQQIYAGVVQIRTHRDVLGDVLALLSLPISSESVEAELASPMPFERQITLTGVGFAYASGACPVLRDISLVVPKGARVGFVGQSGSGKSTLIDLVMGLLVPTEGTIRIDGQVLNERSRLRWQKRIAHVPQTVFLSDATIAENIAFGVDAKDIDMERVQEAARVARVADFLVGLPHGYNTKVGERGTSLSGGQRQRIGIARALYRRADVLVFDEATSALDGKTEAEVMDAIAGLGPDLTVFLVAHRLSTLSICSRIVCIQDGRIAGAGSYEEIVLGETEEAKGRLALRSAAMARA